MKFRRTRYAGTLRAGDIGSTVNLAGWVHRRRDHGGVIFVDLRDRSGLAQVVFNPQSEPLVHKVAHQLRNEFVISVQGEVRRRPEGTINPNLPTGEVEVLVTGLEILNPSETPPFSIEDGIDLNEDVRLKYRFLDLRRPSMHRNMLLRHRVYQVTRKYFDEHGFLEVETPFLTKSTPEGARDYLVPSRLNPGACFALPQSPQLFKQILMVAGMDRYFQIVKCFRDEDLRADRQPEFTQVDVEMSFVERDDVLGVIEGLMKTIYAEVLGTDLAIPLPRLTYAEAMNRFGSDKPDLRYGMELVDISDLAKSSQFKVFLSALETGGQVKGINVPGAANKSRKDLDDLTEYVKIFNARGLAWFKVGPAGLESPIVKFFAADTLDAIRQRMQSAPGDLILIVADAPSVVAQSLGNLRTKLATELNLVPAGQHKMLWVVDFPLFEKGEIAGSVQPMHHPFTSPHPDDVGLIETEPLKVRAQAYDLVLNGSELGGGSIRIHDSSLQKRVFLMLGISDKQAEEKFGFLLNALKYGAPPHGGIALGLDRMVMIFAGAGSIREVIAFPKTQRAACLMTDAPSAVDSAQLRELGLRPL